MLKKRERLTKNEFDSFFFSGRRHHSPTLQLIYTSHPLFHGAVVVGKKVFKKAVERNRLRRRLYALLYTLKKQHNLRGVFIVVAKPAAKSTSFSEIKKELVEMVGRTVKSG